MYKIKALVRYLVLSLVLPAEGAAACRAFLLSVLQEIPEESSE